MSLALAVRDVSHAFGVRKALDNVTFDIHQGDFMALLGLNGAGKTTLFSLITRLYAHRSGSITLFGLDLAQHTQSVLACMGVVFQSPTLDLDLTIEQNLNYHTPKHLSLIHI